jgi:hypothetical protein
VKIGNAKFWAAVPAPRLDGGQHPGWSAAPRPSLSGRARVAAQPSAAAAAAFAAAPLGQFATLDFGQEFPLIWRRDGVPIRR